mgnify:FL=1
MLQSYTRERKTKMKDTEINEKLLAAYPERMNDYQERKDTVNDGEEPNPVELVLYSLAPKLKIRLLRKNEKKIKEEMTALESLVFLKDSDRNDVLSVLFGYLKQEGLLQEAKKYFLPSTLELSAKKNVSD